MPPCLLLALALLGTASASHPASGHPRDVPAATAKGGRRFYYAVVTSRRSYSRAEKHCREVLRGELASVHSAALNQQLKELARTYTHFSPWIGAFTTTANGQWVSQWSDASPWNFANWAPTHPHHIVTTCTTLSTRDGLWRSRPCFLLRPFICQY
ncbi:PRG2 protein, partial [Eurystomus gularis]|nr:PRG2 protein [Eurystomus gularis]